MKRFALACCLVALGLTAAFAKTDPILTRENTMKGVGKAFYGDLNKMQKGQIPYNQAVVDAAFDKIEAAAKTMPTLFPPDSKTGEKTHALPKLWNNLADVDARFKKLGQDAAKAKPSVTDVASLKTAYVMVNKNCAACHQNYRAKLND